MERQKSENITQSSGQSLLSLIVCLYRLENTQYDASNGVGDEGDFGGSPMSGSPSLWSTDRKPNQEDSTGE